MPCIFFFQAEDGIRDYKVTGVQTCALPISRTMRATSAGSSRTMTDAVTRWPAPASSSRMRAPLEIGRASCRGRAYAGVLGDAVNERDVYTLETARVICATRHDSCRLIKWCR